MNIKLTIKNAAIKQTGNLVEIISSTPKQIIDIEVVDVKANIPQERRIYIHDKDEQTKLWMC
jgi:hypothetical protein